ncbi:MAG: TadE/TadG family type IV pilus assembly protein [Elusimicrobiota bacterium]
MLRKINEKFVSKLKDLKRDCRGQMLIIGAFSIFSLVLFWYTMINVGMLVRNRIQVGNAADNAALTGAVARARVLNLIGALSGQLAVKLSLDSYFSPKFVWPFDGQICGCSCKDTNDTRAENIKDAVDTITPMIDSLMDAETDDPMRGYGQALARRAALRTLRSVEEDQFSGIMPFIMSRFPVGDVYIQATEWDGLNLSREELDIKIYPTKVMCEPCGSPPSCQCCEYWPAIGKEIVPDNLDSWAYIEDEEAFKDSLSQTWEVSKNTEFFGNIFGEDNVGWVTSESRAVVYNTEVGDKGDGPMFTTTTPNDSCSTSDPIYSYYDAAKGGGWRAKLVEPD